MTFTCVPPMSIASTVRRDAGLFVFSAVFLAAFLAIDRFSLVRSEWSSETHCAPQPRSASDSNLFARNESEIDKIAEAQTLTTCMHAPHPSDQCCTTVGLLYSACNLAHPSDPLMLRLAGFVRQTAAPPRSPFDSISFAKNESESKNQRSAILNNTFATSMLRQLCRADQRERRRPPVGERERRITRVPTRPRCCVPPPVPKVTPQRLRDRSVRMLAIPDHRQIFGRDPESSVPRC